MVTLNDRFRRKDVGINTGIAQLVFLVPFDVQRLLPPESHRGSHNMASNTAPLKKG
jgi:hypothetical protein